MFHPYIKHTPLENHPYALYQKLCQRKKTNKCANAICRDNPRGRSHNRNITGYPAINTVQELHPYEQFVEGFIGSPGMRMQGCCLTDAPSTPCTNAGCGGKMYDRWTSFRSGGMVPLFKEDFQVLPDKSIALYHPRFVNKTAFVVFVAMNCPDCQDTKQTWQAYAIEAYQLIGGNGTLGDILNTRICTIKIQYLMFKRRDGSLVDYVGAFNVARLKEYLEKVCLQKY